MAGEDELNNVKGPCQVNLFLLPKWSGMLPIQADKLKAERLSLSRKIIE
tara:strand:- start:115 stop:261 length:147 start_codon:yes stop_codon:yes gene_type:complete